MTTYFGYGLTITGVTEAQEDQIFLTFAESSRQLQLFAAQDCCSISWFETVDPADKFADLVGRPLHRIEKTSLDHQFPPSTYSLSNIDKDCDKEEFYQVTFADGSDPFFFAVRNSSNGYYSGWLEMSNV